MSDKTYTEAEIYKAAFFAYSVASKKPLAYQNAMQHGINEFLSQLGLKWKVDWDE